MDYQNNIYVYARAYNEKQEQKLINTGFQYFDVYGILIFYITIFENNESFIFYDFEVKLKHARQQFLNAGILFDDIRITL